MSRFSNVLVTLNEHNGSFRAYRVPEKMLLKRLLDTLASGVSFLMTMSTINTSRLRVGNTVTDIKTQFEQKVNAHK
jgi:hypothetical protein